MEFQKNGNTPHIGGEENINICGEKETRSTIRPAVGCPWKLLLQLLSLDLSRWEKYLVYIYLTSKKTQCTWYTMYYVGVLGNFYIL